jgi:hypothetical protein
MAVQKGKHNGSNGRQTVQRPVGQQLRQSDQSPWTAKSFVSRGSKYSAYSDAAKGRWLAEAGASRAAHPASVARQPRAGNHTGNDWCQWFLPQELNLDLLNGKYLPVWARYLDARQPNQKVPDVPLRCAWLLLAPSLWVWGTF